MKAQGSCGLAWGDTLGEARAGSSVQRRGHEVPNWDEDTFFFLSGGDERYRSEVSGQAKQNREVEWVWGGRMWEGEQLEFDCNAWTQRMQAIACSFKIIAPAILLATPRNGIMQALYLLKKIPFAALP